jgi:hypothetical protein
LKLENEKMALNDINAKDEHKYPDCLAAMQSVMRRPTFTFREVYTAGDQARKGATTLTCYRWADRLLRRARLAGSIRPKAGGAWINEGFPS